MTDHHRPQPFWDEILLAFLHDPPDKALSISGHVPDARDNATIALGDCITSRMLEDAVCAADPLASMIERLVVPAAGEQGQRAFGPVDGQLQILHPLSGAAVSLPVPELNEAVHREQRQLSQIIADLPGQGQEQGRNGFMAVWRLWPDALSLNVNPCFAKPPADTRTADHTIWNHLDVTAAFTAAEADSGAALLAFVLGPVQRFIEAARSVQGLWSGSMILSWLAFRAMLPIIEQLGPTALIYPAIRGNPLLDLWLRHGERLGDKYRHPRFSNEWCPYFPTFFLRWCRGVVMEWWRRIWPCSAKRR